MDYNQAMVGQIIAVRNRGWGVFSTIWCAALHMELNISLLFQKSFKGK